MKTYHYQIIQPVKTGQAWELRHILSGRTVGSRYTRREIRALKAELEARLQTAMNIAGESDAHAAQGR